MVSEGRFGNISTIYDPEKNIVRGGVKSNHNAYGYVTSTRNYQAREISCFLFCVVCVGWHLSLLGSLDAR